MNRNTRTGRIAMLMAAALTAALWVSLGGASAASMHESQPFMGVKVNGGTVTHSNESGRIVLTLSDDFKVPDTPAPHWQVVDSDGNIYLLQRLVVKGDKYNKSIVVPSYVKDVVKVQIWCAWAEALLGETTFDKPVK